MLRAITMLTVATTLALGGAGCGDDDEDAATPLGPGTDTAADTTATTDEEAAGDDRGTQPVGSADVTLTEFEVDVAQKTLPREGVYTLDVMNEGDITHALESEGPNGETETEEIPPGESTELDVYFVNGTYKLYCPIGDHEQRGMVTRLEVKS